MRCARSLRRSWLPQIFDDLTLDALAQVRGDLHRVTAARHGDATDHQILDSRCALELDRGTPRRVLAPAVLTGLDVVIALVLGLDLELDRILAAAADGPRS